MDAQVRLREREKELACIYSICLLAAAAPEPPHAAEGIARALCRAMQHPELARCTVEFRDPDGTVAVFDTHAGEGEFQGPRIAAELPAGPSAGWGGSIRILYGGAPGEFLAQEKALLESVATVAASMLGTADLIARLRAASSTLAAKNTALREILSMIEQERASIAGTYRRRLAEDILPLVERAADPGLPEERRDSYLALLADEVRQQMRALGPGPDNHPALSPREREVALQVRNGRTSKEIAQLLGIAEATVERHRHNIRRKLKGTERGFNLESLLASGWSGAEVTAD